MMRDRMKFQTMCHKQKTSIIEAKIWLDTIAVREWDKEYITKAQVEIRELRVHNW